MSNSSPYGDDLFYKFVTCDDIGTLANSLTRGEKGLPISCNQFKEQQTLTLGYIPLLMGSWRHIFRLDGKYWPSWFMVIKLLSQLTNSYKFMSPLAFLQVGTCVNSLFSRVSRFYASSLDSRVYHRVSKLKKLDQNTCHFGLFFAHLGFKIPLFGMSFLN